MAISSDEFLSKIRGGSPVTDFPLEECAVLAETSIHAAAAIGDPDGVRHHLDREPGLVNVPREGWTPLAYLCGEPFFQLTVRHITTAGQCAAILLDRGADPVATITQEAPDAASGTPTFALAQIRKNLGVAVTFAERGIGHRNITDEDRAQIGFALLGMPKPSPLRTAVMQLEADPGAKQQLQQLRASARAAFDNLLPTGSFKDRLSTMQTRSQHRAVARWRLSFDRGLAPNLASMDNGGTHLHYLAGHRLVGGSAVARLFLEYGADPNALTADGRTPLSYAVRTGNTEVANVLMEFGAQAGTVRISDRFMSACFRADVAAAREIATTHPDVFVETQDECAELLVHSSGFSDCYGAVTDRIRLLGELGFDFGRTGRKGCTGLHIAAWHGLVENVRAYVEFVSVNSRDLIYGTSPLGWIAHGSGSHEKGRNAEDDTAVVKLLLEHGAEPRFAVNRWGVGPKDIASQSLAALFPSG